MFKRSKFFYTLAVLTACCQYVVVAKEPWQVNQAYAPTPNSPVALPKYSNATTNGSTWSSSGKVPAFSPDFLQKQLAYSIAQGTILTGVIETTISSKVSKPGTIISIILPLGYKNNNVTIIPPSSKIIGVVMNAQESANLNHGHPGRIEISLQTLVFPSGKSAEFHGFISHNVSQDQMKAAITRNSGFDLKDYPQLGTSFVRSFGLGVGAFMKKSNQGKELNIIAGTVVPIKVTRRLDLANMNNFSYQSNPIGVNNYQQFGQPTQAGNTYSKNDTSNLGQSQGQTNLNQGAGSPYNAYNSSAGNSGLNNGGQSINPGQANLNQGAGSPYNAYNSNAGNSGLNNGGQSINPGQTNLNQGSSLYNAYNSSTYNSSSGNTGLNSNGQGISPIQGSLNQGLNNSYSNYNPGVNNLNPGSSQSILGASNANASQLNIPPNLAPLPPNNIDNLLNPNSSAAALKQSLEKNPNSIFEIPVDGYPSKTNLAKP